MSKQRQPKKIKSDVGGRFQRPFRSPEPHYKLHKPMMVHTLAQIDRLYRPKPKMVKPGLLTQKTLRRLPILGLRSLRTDSTTSRGRSKRLLRNLREITHPVRAAKARVTTCVKRKLRRNALFAQKIAGHGRKKSPGKGGTYKKTSDSLLTCVTRRK